MLRHIILLLLLVGCTASQGGGHEGPITVTDVQGRTVALEEYPERIVSLAPSNTEILFALGLGDKVVGVTEYCDYPPEAKEKQTMGGFSTVDIEQVLALEPDLVLGSTQTGDENIAKLEELGIPVMVLNPEDVQGVLDDIEMVGRLTGAVEEAGELTADMKNRIAAVQDRLLGRERPKVFYVIWHDPLMSAGEGTFISDLINMAGGENVAEDLEGYQTMSLEVLVDRDPEVIIASTGDTKHTTYDWVLAEERLKGTNAVENDRVYVIDQNIVNRGGPRIVDALEEFAMFIHPEAY